MVRSDPILPGGAARWFVIAALLLLLGAIHAERESARELALRLRAFADAEQRLTFALAEAGDRSSGGAASGELIGATAQPVTDAAWIRAAAFAIAAGQLASAEELLARIDSARRHFEWHHLDLCRTLAVAPLTPSAESLTLLALSHDGRRVITCDLAGNLALHDVATRTRLTTHSLADGAVSALAIAARADLIAAGTEQGDIFLLDGNTLALRHHTSGVASVRALAFAAAAPRLAVAGDDGVVHLLDTTTGEVLRAFAGESGAIGALAIDAAASALFAAADDGAIAIIDAITGTVRQRIDGDGDAIVDLRCDAAGRRLLMRNEISMVQFVDATSGAVTHRIGGPLRSIDAVDLDPGGDVAVLGHVDGRIEWVDTSGRSVRSLGWEQASIVNLAMARAGEVIAFACGDERAFVVDRAGGPPLAIIGEDTDSARGIAPDPAGTELLVADERGVALRDAAAGAASWSRAIEQPSALGWTQDGAHALVGRADGTVEILDRRNGTTQHLLTSAANPVAAVAELTSGAIAIVHENGAFMTADRASGAALRSSPAPGPPVLGVAIAGDRVAWAAAGGNVRVWDLTTAARLAAFKVDDIGMISAFAYSADADCVALAFRNGRIELWDVTTGRPRSAARVLDDSWGQALTFSADGTRLAVAGFSGEVALLDASAGELLLHWRTPLREAAAIAFLRADRALVIGAAAGPLVRIESALDAWQATR